jgi:farnesol dehydrogenase
MTIFITGATGFIGTRLCLTLAERGEQVHALVRSPQKAKSLEHPRIKLFKGDLHDIEVLAEGMKGCEGVIHLAAFADTWHRDPQFFYKVNVQGTINVLEAAVAQGVKRVVVTSTAGTLGPSYQGDPVTEETVRREDFHTEYESSKFVSEEHALRFIKKGLDVMIVHPTRVYGPGELSVVNSWTKLTKMWMQKGFAVALGNGHSVGNFVFVDDVVEGHLLALRKGRAGERYLLGSENASSRDFFKILTEVTGRKGRVITFRLWALYPLSMFYAWRARWFKVHPLILPEWVARYAMDWVSSSDKARNELGYAPRSLREGLKDTTAWLKSKDGKN